jgi:hypothetical protein
LCVSRAVLQERVAGGRRRADEIGDRLAADPDHAIAQPPRAGRMFDAIRLREPRIQVEVRAYIVGIEMNPVQFRRQHLGKRGLACSRPPIIRIFWSLRFRLDWLQLVQNTRLGAAARSTILKHMKNVFASPMETASTTTGSASADLIKAPKCSIKPALR